MSSHPCGTLAAETRHRVNGTWPCESCDGVRAAIAEMSSQQGVVRRVMADMRKRLHWWTDAELLDACRTAWTATHDLPRFCAVTGIRPKHADAFVRWMLGTYPKTGAA